MWVLDPIDLDAAQITASNIAEDDAQPWVAGTYNTGDVRMHQNDVWECLQDNVTSEPSPDVELDWFRRGPINKFRPFDQANLLQAEAENEVTYTIVPGRRINQVAFLDLDATSVRVNVVSGASVYDQTRSPLRSENRGTHYAWHFAERQFGSTLVFDDLPIYSNSATAEVRITVTKSGVTAKVGEILVGQRWEIGRTLYQTAARILNLSEDRLDAFGNVTLTARRSTREVTYQVAINPTLSEYLLEQFQGLTGKKLLFSAGKDLGVYGTTLFATAQEVEIPQESPTKNRITIKVRGFIA